MIQVAVGPEQTIFHIYKQLLSDASPYFKAAISGGYKESFEQKIELPEENPSMFERFQLWLYTGSIIELHEKDRLSSKVLVDLYIFGETRIIPGLQNAVIDSTIDELIQYQLISVRSIDYLYANTSKRSPIRKLYVEMIVDNNIDLKDLKWGIKGEAPGFTYPREFLADVILSQHDRLAGHRQKCKDFSKERERYYVLTSFRSTNAETAEAALSVKPP
ncbi:MAG: hypothetical protein Q9195_000546 [Heterodermia aff. obscurata]